MKKANCLQTIVHNQRADNGSGRFADCVDCNDVWRGRDVTLPVGLESAVTSVEDASWQTKSVREKADGFKAARCGRTRIFGRIKAKIARDDKKMETKYEIRNTKYETGFTLIEIIVVVMIIAIAAMMAVPMLSSATGMQARSAAGIIAADLEYAKNMAITHQQRYAVVFDESNECYRIEDQNGNVIAHPVKKGFDYIVDFRSNPRLNNVDISTADFDSTPIVKFDYLGSAWNGIGGALNSGAVTVQAGGQSITVNVAPMISVVAGYVEFVSE